MANFIDPMMSIDIFYRSSTRQIPLLLGELNSRPATLLLDVSQCTTHSASTTIIGRLTQISYYQFTTNSIRCLDCLMSHN